jgi:acyl carrier protein
MDIEAIVTRFIIEELLRGNVSVSVERNTSLISTQILDSLALLKLLLFIEERFGIKVEDGEVIPGNFETVNRIRAFVESKKSGRLRPTEA